MPEPKMKNFRLDVQANTLELFQAAMRIAFSRAPSCKAYCVSDKRGLILLADIPKPAEIHDLHFDQKLTAIPQAYEMQLEEMIVWSWGWLARVHPMKKGFRVYTEESGRIAGIAESIVAIQAVDVQEG